jgi:transposase
MSTNITSENGLQFIGCDLGDKTTALCHLDAMGNVLLREEVKTERETLARHFRALPKCEVVLEVGTHSPWVAATVRAAGHSVVAVNPHRFKLIAASRKKTDTNDAELLARARRMDVEMLQPVKHRGEKTRAQLAMLRSRDLLVSTRTSLVNHIRGVMKSFGVKTGSCRTATFHERVVPFIPVELTLPLSPLLATLASVSEQIQVLDESIEQLAEQHQEVLKILTSIPRVGTLTALGFLLVIEEPLRFKKSRDVGAYLGLCPARRQSGQSDPKLGITKEGDRLLRKLLVQCAQQQLFEKTQDSELSRAGKHLLKEGKSRNLVAVALARKLACLMHRLWVKNERFTSFPNQRS